ncbi:hypothetical protein BD410DRAFT_893550 [Rickenella mellea]|uniref:G-patch domain-containing protein n=1 Tax=Rickenella mellea TaxID=50990 RepID=A0A4Y7QMU6_9AGAM|nr:hypothetical protein BD410DRAFT_893550 [Rickenella mellea]
MDRWNAIQLERKRARSDGDDSSEDNISLVSRSPSPQPAQDVEMTDLHLYDEHISGDFMEVVTVETKIKSSNKGFAMLAKLGWKEGQPLGISGEGRVDPIPFTLKNDLTGLGKINQDVKMIETTVSQRRGLDSERMRKETEEQRKRREDAVAQKAAVDIEISSVLKAFYCALCDKQFKNVAQYDEHTNSYAHHHKARTKDMQANHPLKQGGKEETERRKEKERKREAKELKKIAAAAGVKIAVPQTSFAVVGTSATPTSEVKGSKPGWAAVSSATSTPAAYLEKMTTEPLAGFSQATGSGSGWQTISQQSPPSPSTAPNFRAGGWETLPSPTESSAPHPIPPSPRNPPPPPPPSDEPPPPPPPRSGWSADPLPPKRPGWNTFPLANPSQQTSRSGWSAVSSAVSAGQLEPARGGWSAISTTTSSTAPPHPPSRPESSIPRTGSWATSTNATNVTSSSDKGPSSVLDQQNLPKSPTSRNDRAANEPQPGKSWRQFQKGRGGGRR